VNNAVVVDAWVDRAQAESSGIFSHKKILPFINYLFILINQEHIHWWQEPHMLLQWIIMKTLVVLLLSSRGLLPASSRKSSLNPNSPIPPFLKCAKYLLIINLNKK
jgi:hypothetical protein